MKLLDNTKTLPSPSAVPCGLAWDGRRLWHADHERQLVYEVDPESGAVGSELPVPNASCDTAWTAEGLWQVVPAEQRLVLVDPKTRAVLRSIPSPIKPYGLTFDGTHLWIGSWPPSTALAVIDPMDGRVVRTLDAPSETCGMEMIGDHLWYTRKDKSLVCSTKSGALVGVWTLSAKPGGLAFDGRALWWVDQETTSLQRVDLPEIE